jgi:uncharacterized protein YjbI with pentapeptide repeats
MTLNGSEISQITWLQRDRKRGADAAENLGFYALRSKNFGLVLPGLDVIDHTKLDTEAKIAAVTETVSLRARHLEGAVLISAVLRKADFTAAHLERADLTTADFRDANFRCTGWVDSGFGLGVSISQERACTQLQGAALKGTQLQGADLNGTQLEGAFLRNVFVWRTDARSADARSTRIDGTTSEPKRDCTISGCDWSDVWWGHFKNIIGNEDLEDALRAKIVKRLDPRLDPAKPLKDEAENGRGLGQASELGLSPKRL